MYADFLDEAGQIRKKPGLQDAASLFLNQGRSACSTSILRVHDLEVKAVQALQAGIIDR